MSNVLMVTLSEKKPCTKCKQDIEAGEYAVRKQVPETRRAAARTEYYHPGCWTVK